MSEFVVWFDSSEIGAPVLNNAAGSLISVLDACLVTGFNTKPVTSIAVAGGVATATCSGHGFSGTFGKDVLIAGATPALLNGRKALTFVDTNTFKFATTAPDGVATGTITAKRDAVGWLKQFSGTNKAVYKRSDVTASSMMLRIDDTNVSPATTTDSRARMIESATDIDTVIGLSPTDAQVAGGHFIGKGQNSSSAKSWVLVGSGKFFYLLTSTSLSALRQPAYFFGDFTSYKAGDAYNCISGGAASALAGEDRVAGPISDFPGFVAGKLQLAIARSFNQTGTCVLGNHAGYGVIGSGAASTGNPTYPSPIDSGLLINPQIVISENATGFPARGVMPGLCQLLAQAPFARLQIVEPIVSLPNRKLLAVIIGSGNSDFQFAIDITGPWA